MLLVSEKVWTWASIGGSNLSTGKLGFLGLILCHLFTGEGVVVHSWTVLSCLLSMTMALSCIFSTNDRINSFCSSCSLMSVWSLKCARYEFTWSTSNEWNMRGIQIHLQCNWWRKLAISWSFWLMPPIQWL